MKLKAKLRKTLSSPSLSGRSRSKIIPVIPDTVSFCHSEALENDHHRPLEAFTTLPSRLHKQDAHGVESVKLLSAEMMVSISQLPSDFRCRLDSDVGHVSSLLFPECLPERLDAVAMILEGAAFQRGMNALVPIMNKANIKRKDMHDHDGLGRDSTNRMVSALLGVGDLRRGQDLEEEKLVSKLVHWFNTKYGEEGQVLAKRILGSWLQPMEGEVKANTNNFDGFISQQIAHASTRYVCNNLMRSFSLT